MGFRAASNEVTHAPAHREFPRRRRFARRANLHQRKRVFAPPQVCGPRQPLPAKASSCGGEAMSARAGLHVANLHQRERIRARMNVSARARFAAAAFTRVRSPRASALHRQT
jgi:hypothetical protein